MSGDAAGHLAHAHHRAVQANPHRRVRAIETAVVGDRRHDVFARAARNRVRDQRSHQQARDRRVAVRIVKAIRAAGRVTSRGVTHARARRPFAEAKTLESLIAHRPAIERGLRVDADAPLALGAALIDFGDRRIHLRGIEQVAPCSSFATAARASPRPTDPADSPRLVELNAPPVGARLGSTAASATQTPPRRQRRPRHRARPASAAAWCADDELVGAEGLLVEEVRAAQIRHAQTHRRLPRASSRSAPRGSTPSDFSRPSAVALYWRRAVDASRAAVHQQHAAAEMKLVALGVAAEVVVVVEHQDPRRLRLRAAGRNAPRTGR